MTVQRFYLEFPLCFDATTVLSFRLPLAELVEQQKLSYELIDRTLCL